MMTDVNKNDTAVLEDLPSTPEDAPDVLEDLQTPEPKRRRKKVPLIASLAALGIFALGVCLIAFGGGIGSKAAKTSSSDKSTDTLAAAAFLPGELADTLSPWNTRLFELPSSVAEETRKTLFQTGLDSGDADAQAASADAEAVASTDDSANGAISAASQTSTTSSSKTASTGSTSSASQADSNASSSNGSASSNSSVSASKSTSNTATSSNTNSSSSGGTSTSSSEPSTGATSSNTQSESAHTHNWVYHDAVYKTVHHDAVYTTVHHDAVTEYYEYILCCCGEVNPSKEHLNNHVFNHEDCWTTVKSGWRTVSDAYDEQVLVSAAYDEQVLVSAAYYSCSCGATK